MPCERWTLSRCPLLTLVLKTTDNRSREQSENKALKGAIGESFLCPLKPNSTPSSLGTHTTFSSLLEMPHAGNDLQAPDKKSYLALKLYQYNLLTGLYMLDPWERYLFSKCTPKVQATTPPQRLGQPWIVLNV